MKNAKTNSKVTKATKVEEIDNLFSEIKTEETPVVRNKINLEKAPKEIKPEVKATVKPEVKEDNALEYVKASRIIETEIHINPELKIVATENASGNSYFSGRTRLFKLLKSKRGISLEINVVLPKEFCKTLTTMEDISIATAHAKHLGTMKHHYRSSNANEVCKIIHAILTTFKASIKKEEVKKSIQEIEITTKAV